MGLTEEQLAEFQREGVLCIENFLTTEEIDCLLKRSQDYLKDFDVSRHPKTQFKTGDNDHVGDQYFFDSSDKISFFFDTDAFDVSTGELKLPKNKAINKIGHGLHMKDESFKNVTFSKKVQGVARSLQFKDPRVLQSMCIFKHPVSSSGLKERDNAVPPHTDGTFLYTEPQSAIGFWFSLEDCNSNNGCLLYNPGSHKLFPINKRFVKVDEGRSGCNFMSLDVTSNGKSLPVDSLEDYKMVECKAGSLVLIHNSVLHKSEKNKSEKSRFAYTFHVIEGAYEYDELNWLQVPPNMKNARQFSKLY